MTWLKHGQLLLQMCVLATAIFMIFLPENSQQQGAGGIGAGSTTASNLSSAPPSSTTSSDSSSQCPEEELRSWLVQQAPYLSSSNGRPVTSQSAAVGIDIEVFVTRFLSINDLDQFISFQGKITISWNLTTAAIWLNSQAARQSLSHNAAQVGRLTFTMDAMWFPKIVMANSHTVSRVDKMADEIRVNPSGRASYDAVGRFEMMCPLNFQAFPFDEQRCGVELYYDKITRYDEMSFNTFQLAIMNGLYPERGFTFDGSGDIWTMVGKGISRPSPSESLVRFYFDFRRSSGYYAITIFTPFELLMVLNLVAIILPPDTFDRSAFMIYVIIALSATLSTVLNQIPKTSQSVYLFYYTEVQVGLSVVLAIYSIICILLCREKHYMQKVTILDGLLRMPRIRIIDTIAGLSACGAFIFINVAYYAAVSYIN